MMTTRFLGGFTMTAYRKELDVALDAVKRAVSVCRHAVESISRMKAIEKEDRSPVTVADFAVQAIVCRILRQAFPGEAIVGEEKPEILEKHPDTGRQILNLLRHRSEIDSLQAIIEAVGSAAGEPDSGKRFWTIDPIDGTKGFLRGDQYCVALALVDKGRVVLGVLGCPNFAESPSRPEKVGCIFCAVKGGGSQMIPLENGAARSIAVDSVSGPEEARICESLESRHASHEVHMQISKRLGIRKPPIRIDSQVKYAAVARGEASIYLRLPRESAYREKIWDHAAGAIIVEEAGGQVTDFKGNPIDFSAGRMLRNNRGIVATNGHLHTVVLEAIESIVKPPE
jgi:3'(2'), 5'-bisphosphate nucleotidase